METPILFRKASPPEKRWNNYRGFHPSEEILKKGWKYHKKSRPLGCDIILQRDVAVKMRDGVVIYVDIFRPNTEEKVPVILNSTIFGKSGVCSSLDAPPEDVPDVSRGGIPYVLTSKLETFEGIDPAYWCEHGYAVVNMDVRGAGYSEGDMNWFGPQDSDDNYDVIEWLGVQPWSNGKVSMAGNSWLAITQWYVAAKKPPHLCCIAPWEGHGDMYRSEYMRGGMPDFDAVTADKGYGYNQIEDMTAMMQNYPLVNDYWDSKVADFSQIECPAYVCASYTSPIHCRGTFEGFRQMSSKEKWLRVHCTNEWKDLYTRSDDLLKFYDHYMKGIDNGWEKTPRVRISILDPGGTDLKDRPENEWPLARQEYKSLYFSPDGSLTETLPDEVLKMEYQGDDGEDKLDFSITFDKDTEITGYIGLKLWMQSPEYDNMDIFVKASKTDANDNPLYHNNEAFNYSGPYECLRVSHREKDESKSHFCEPFYTHRSREPLAPGEIVCFEIGLLPTSLLFHKGEKLHVYISGFKFRWLSHNQAAPTIDNKGKHVLYVGGQYDSCVNIPFIPAK